MRRAIQLEAKNDILSAQVRELRKDAEFAREKAEDEKDARFKVE